MSDQVIDRALAPAVDHERKVRLEQILRHGASHDAQPNEADSVDHGGEYIEGWRDRVGIVRAVSESLIGRVT